MANVYLKLGPKATTFYDMATGLQVSNKEIIEVNPKYISRGRRTSRAIQGGHLVYSTKEEYEAYRGISSSEDKANTEATNKADRLYDLSQKFFELYQSGKSTKELAEVFTKNQLIELAEASDLEVEDSDTKATLVEAIVEQITASGK